MQNKQVPCGAGGAAYWQQRALHLQEPLHPLPAPRAHKVPLCPQPPSLRFGPRFRDSRRCRRILAFPAAPGGPEGLALLADLSENTHGVCELRQRRKPGIPGLHLPQERIPREAASSRALRVWGAPGTVYRYMRILEDAQAVGRILVCSCANRLRG